MDELPNYIIIVEHGRTEYNEWHRAITILWNNNKANYINKRVNNFTAQQQI